MPRQSLGIKYGIYTAYFFRGIATLALAMTRKFNRATVFIKFLHSTYSITFNISLPFGRRSSEIIVARDNRSVASDILFSLLV